jgi:sorbitol/mannitol transport system permease protein
MAFAPTKRTKDILMWMLSTKMMPAVGVLIPIYLIFRDLRLLDTVHGLTIIMTLINLPIIIWMLYTYFKEIPVDILEAARMDGAELWNEIVHVLVPMAVPGIASTLLLNVILAWNEAFWTITLTSGRAGTLTAFISSFSSPQGLFLAKLSAASLLAIAPVLLMGWFSQKQLVRGLTFGAVKYGHFAWPQKVVTGFWTRPGEQKEIHKWARFPCNTSRSPSAKSRSFRTSRSISKRASSSSLSAPPAAASPLCCA